MTKVDDISLGDYVVVTKDLLEIEFDYRTFPPTPIPPTTFSGRPSKVIGIGLPFIVVEVIVDGKEDVHTIDIRRFALQKVDKRYAKVLTPKAYTDKEGKTVHTTPLDGTKQCPECGNSMVETRFQDIFGAHVPGFHEWAFKCSKCNFVGAKRRKTTWASGL